MSAPASSADVTAGVMDAFFGAVEHYVLGPLGVAVLTLFAVLVAFGLVLRWASAAAHGGGGCGNHIEGFEMCGRCGFGVGR